MFAHLLPAPDSEPRDPEASCRRSSSARARPGGEHCRTLPPLPSLFRHLLFQPRLPAELPQRPRRRRRAEGPMRAPLLPPAPVVLSLLILGSAHYAAGSAANDTSSGKGEPFSGDHSADGFEVTPRNGSSGREISPVSETPSSRELSSGIDYDYAEEYDNEPQISGYIVDDSVRVEQVVKPMKNRTESEKTSDKPKRKKKGGKNGKNRKNRKKKNPCDAEFQNFCIHGECKYIENLGAVTCKCHQDYFGERCGEKSMKTHSMVDSDLSKIALAAIAAFVSAVSFTAIAVVITIQLRKRFFREYEGEAEERKKLRQENGNVHAIA
ncbi:amphiregulin isoform X1 [Panthera uncia]|uniref:amphiregulin isoform X1 n=1 Tax=Panthera uncia TaxID=29064 RepID=UPI0020FFE433|nr:amphiregulin isoform X1 [Panthera uncia]